VDDELYALDFMDAFNKMGFVSFLHDESFNEWKEYFGLLGGRV